MIDTYTSTAAGSVDHIGQGTVTVEQLLAAIDATPSHPSSICWDFRNADFDVALCVLQAPCYPPVRDHINSQWQDTPVAFIVSAHLHKNMVELFAAEGGFRFDHRLFFSHDEAQTWLSHSQPAHNPPSWERLGAASAG